MVKKASGVKRKVPDEDVSGEGNVAEKAEDAALDEEEEQRQEGAYDEVPGDEEDEVREEYADGMQMHHPSTWVKFKKGWTPVYRTKDGVELYRKPFAPVDPFAKKTYKRDALGNPIMEKPQYSQLPKDWRETGYLKNGPPSKKSSTAARAPSDASTAVRTSS